ncbi:MAG: hypothetical protein DGJ47_000711 [Rickettsiaceae bacterium]
MYDRASTIVEFIRNPTNFNVIAPRETLTSGSLNAITEAMQKYPQATSFKYRYPLEINFNVFLLKTSKDSFEKLGKELKNDQKGLSEFRIQGVDYNKINAVCEHQDLLIRSIIEGLGRVIEYQKDVWLLTKLTKLSLVRVGFGPDSAKLLAELVLSESGYLECLNLSQNKIGAEGARAIF